MRGGVAHLLGAAAVVKPRPVSILKRGLRAALRRRYAYVALRIVRRAFSRALDEELRRCIGPKPWVTEYAALCDVFVRGMRRLERRFGAERLRRAFEDPRAEWRREKGGRAP